MNLLIDKSPDTIVWTTDARLSLSGRDLSLITLPSTFTETTRSFVSTPYKLSGIHYYLLQTNYLHFTAVVEFLIDGIWRNVGLLKVLGDSLFSHTQHIIVKFPKVTRLTITQRNVGKSGIEITY